MNETHASIPPERPFFGAAIMPTSAPPPSAEGSTLSDLQDRAMGGDRDAWDVLYRLFHRRVLLSLLGKGVAMARAQELSQNAWERVMERSDQGRLTALKLPGLIITVAHRMAVDAWRRQKFEHLYTDDAEMDRAMDGGVLPEQRAADRERLSRALAALDRLAERKPRARQVFLMTYGDGLPASEVAQQLGISVQRVRQTICEVRKHLRTELEK
jgi:RNA polymerase sigma factor (sigma-70 family)